MEARSPQPANLGRYFVEHPAPNSKQRHVPLMILCILLFAFAFSARWAASDPVAFHKSEMKRFHDAMFSQPEKLGDGLVVYSYGDNQTHYEHHRDSLVRLGALTRISASFVHIHGDTPEARHLSRALLQSDQPGWGGPLCVDGEWHEGENFELTIWCDPDLASAWRTFIKLRDTPNYRDEFMQ
jgi:hypothetical protein